MSAHCITCTCEPLSDPTLNMVGKQHAKPTPAERAAAYAMLPKSGTQRMACLDAFYRHEEGLTDDELGEAANAYRYSAAARRTELMEGGWVVYSGLDRLSPRGAMAGVYVMTNRGRADYADYLTWADTA